MKNLGNYYGATLIDTTDLVDTSNKNRIILELNTYIIEQTGRRNNGSVGGLVHAL